MSKPSCDCKKFIEISYQDILEEILENILKEDISSQTKVIIKDYIHCITTPSNNSKNQNIMAMDEETRELLIKFWDSNEELIRAAIEALAWDSKDENAEEVLKLLNKRDYTKYELEGKKPINKSHLAS